MAAFAQRCCGKDTKWRAGSLKVYGFLTKDLMERALSLFHPPAATAPYGAKRRQNAFINMAAASFRNHRPPQFASGLRTKSGNRSCFQQTRFVAILANESAEWA